jgi:hypothetical protein
MEVNMHIASKGFIVSVVICTLLLLMTACGGGGGGSDPKQEAPAGDLSGTWEIQETINGNCQGEDYPITRTQVFAITQSGNHFTFVAPDSTSVNGTISGNSVTWRGSWREDGGTLTNKFSGTLSGDGNRIDGSSTWTWADADYSCNGTAQFVLTRLPQATGDASGTWEGTWSSTSYGISGSFTAKITQTGTNLSGTIDVPDVGIIDTELKGTASGESMIFGDINDRITFTGTRSGSNNASGTYTYPGMSDSGSWQATKTGEPVAPAVTWQRTDMGSGFSGQVPVIIADGRNDGTLAVYTGQGQGGGSTGRITEYCYGPSGWESTIFGDIADWAEQDLTHLYGLAMGEGQNDGVTRLYAAGWGAAEFTHSEGGFVGAVVAGDIQWTNSILVGDARNDGVVRIYIGGWDTIHEIHHQTNTWERTTIDTGGLSIGPLIIAEGRNDGVTRLYAAANRSEHVYEYTYVSGQWQVDDCGASGLGTIQSMVVGDGRNDSKIRFYLAGNGGAQELSFEGDAWVYRDIGDSLYATAIALGPGRKDGRNYIYIAESQNDLCEYAYVDDSWAKASQIDTDLAFDGIAVGNGRNDGVTRVYATCRDDHVYEYTAEP